MRIPTSVVILGAGLAATLSLSACDLFEREEPRMAEEAEAAAYFASHPAVEKVSASGNVVEIRVAQSTSQLRRGGNLWAKVGPFIHLFSPATRQLLAEHPGVAAVRVVTYDDSANEVACAMMRRDTMNGILWERSLSLLGQALEEGTTRPTRLEELVRWGEEHTEYEYSPEYVSHRQTSRVKD